jgi:hypothetical protein
MTKHKSTTTRPHSNGHHAATTGKSQPKSDGLKHQSGASPRASRTFGKHTEAMLEKFQGLLEEFNFSPKGGIEGFLLHSEGKTVQVNVSPEVGFAVVRGIGQHVEASVEPESGSTRHSTNGHAVYSLVTLTGPDGKTLIHSGTGNAEMVTIQGVVKRINYARHGEADGVILESGDFIHLKAEGMKNVGLKPGDTVTAEGTTAMMPLGQQVIEAKTVNGTSLMKKPGRPSRRRPRS